MRFTVSGSSFQVLSFGVRVPGLKNNKKPRVAPGCGSVGDSSEEHGRERSRVARPHHCSAHPESFGAVGSAKDGGGAQSFVRGAQFKVHRVFLGLRFRVLESKVLTL